MGALAKDMEIRQALAESESTLQHTIKQLAEFKSRALQAEVSPLNADQLVVLILCIFLG